MTPQFLDAWIQLHVDLGVDAIERIANEESVLLTPNHLGMFSGCFRESLMRGLLMGFACMCGIEKLTSEEYTAIEQWVRHEKRVSEKLTD